MTLTKKKYKNDTIEAYISEFKTDAGMTEYHVLLSGTDPFLPFPEQLRNLRLAYEKIEKEELHGNAAAVFRRYFLSDAANQAPCVTTSWETERPCALSVVEQAPLNGTKAALWAWFQTDVRTETPANGMSKAAHNGYVQYWTGSAGRKAADSAAQTDLLLNDYLRQLEEEGCSLADNCIRTWFFVQNVDVNYAGVVKARREVFRTCGLNEYTHYIASTGIEGRHADPGIFVQMDAYAVKGLRPEQIEFLYAPTHLNPTYEYGVTFERGTAVTYGDRRHVFISGTASIDNQGEIVHPGDIRKQAERMFENISVLLAEAGACEKDVMQAIVYLRDPSDYAVVRQYLETEHPGLPHVVVHAPVCRPGWLLETECIAVIPAENPGYPAF